jgi:hypothetical protein
VKSQMQVYRGKAEEDLVILICSSQTSIMSFHHLDLHFRNALKLLAGSIHDLLRPPQRPGSLRHLLNKLLAVFLIALGRVDAPGRHSVKGCVHRLARLIRKSGNRHRGFAETPDRAVAFAGVLFERRAIDDLDLQPTCIPLTTVS